jgi:hypothetical protein
MTEATQETQDRIPDLEVVDAQGVAHAFSSTGLDETYAYDVNEYTGELIVERITWGPRGNDAFARLGATVVAAWASDRWARVTRTNGAVAGGAGDGFGEEEGW